MLEILKVRAHLSTLCTVRYDHPRENRVKPEKKEATTETNEVETVLNKMRLAPNHKKYTFFALSLSNLVKLTSP